MKRFSFRIIDEQKKIIEFCYGRHSQQFQLKVKRAFTVLKQLAIRYPDYMNIHALDSVYNDPNRALSDLRITDAWDSFIDIESRENRVVHARLNVEQLFSTINLNSSMISFHSDEGVVISTSQKKLLLQKFDSKCNITGIALRDVSTFDDPRIFMKRYQIPAYDHRRPLSKFGTNEVENLQLISEQANQEKNRICNSCNYPKCNICALAYPENASTIYPTKQDISGLRRT